MILQAVCFAENRFEDQAAKKCLSNLLAAGFRRIILDLYWNPFLDQWSLCPAALPSQDPGSARSSVLSTTSLSASAPSGVLALTQSPGTTASGAAGHSSLNVRQITSALSSSAKSSATSAMPTSTSEPIASPSEVPGSPGLYQIGPYQCTTSVDIDLVRAVFEDHFGSTQTTINATLKYLILNLHDSSLFSDVPQNPPSGPQQISRTLINATFAGYLYTPDMLSSERSNLNNSWFSTQVPLNNQPDRTYFHYTVDESGKASTSEGWPSEGYTELSELKRMLIGFGTTDFDDSQYSLLGDGHLVFGPGELSTPRLIGLAANGTVASGCILDVSPTSLAAINDSYAIPAQALANVSSLALDGAASSLTMCGISPVLNATLLNATADVSITPYMSFVGASSWSWLPGQPADQNAAPNTNFHCAAMNISTSSKGRWQVSFCATRLFGACQANDAPLNWTLTAQRGEYDAVNDACPDGASFSVPRTAAENAALRDVALTAIDVELEPDTPDQLIWLNFNDLDRAGCWVTGVDNRCPYDSTKVATASRRVAVPIVAAVIVFCLAALTVLVKCAASRRGQERRRLRGGQQDGRGEYEGIPS